VRDGATKTRLSVVSLAPDGERSFIFYKDHPADAELDRNEIAPRFIEGVQVLHVGSLLMAAPRSAAAQERAIALARANGTMISTDPNLRPGLWPDEKTMIAAGRHLIASAQIVKLSVEELSLLSGGGPIEIAVKALWHSGMKILAVTKGAGGAELFTSSHRIVCRSYSVHAVDTLAAGDAFMASLLSGLLDHGLETDGEGELHQILRRACAAGALAATRKGAMSSLPGTAEITRLLATQPENPN